MIDEEESEEGESEEDNFHGGVVERDKGCQQVQVPVLLVMLLLEVLLKNNVCSYCWWC